jgi:flagellar FliJ protein
MKRFEFSLQTVHDFRHRKREEAEREFAEATSKVAQAEALLEEIQCKRAEALEAYALQLQSSQLDPNESLLRLEYLSALERQAITAQAQLRLLEEACEVRRQALVEANRAAEATEKLREQQRARHEAETAREEQNSLDEMATAATARRLTEESVMSSRTTPRNDEN